MIASAGVASIFFLFDRAVSARVYDTKKENSMRNAVLAGFALGICLIGDATAQKQNVTSYSLIRSGCRIFVEGSEFKTSDEIFYSGMCAGLVAGVQEADTKVCAPPSSNLAQAVAVVVRYAEKIPHRWHENRIIITKEALRQAWPCR